MAPSKLDNCISLPISSLVGKILNAAFLLRRLTCTCISFQTMVDVIPADTDDIPSNVLEETWELPFTEDCTNMELVSLFET